MSGKVTVTKEVAEAIEYRRSTEGGRYTFAMFMAVATARFDYFGSPVEVLNVVSIETLASALINGYEVEKSPEEKIREYYGKLDKRPLSKDLHCDWYEARGVTRTLDMLGIKIEGVNG